MAPRVLSNMPSNALCWCVSLSQRFKRLCSRSSLAGCRTKASASCSRASPRRRDAETPSRAPVLSTRTHTPRRLPYLFRPHSDYRPHPTTLAQPRPTQPAPFFIWIRPYTPASIRHLLHALSVHRPARYTASPSPTHTQNRPSPAINPHSGVAGSHPRNRLSRPPLVSQRLLSSIFQYIHFENGSRTSTSPSRVEEIGRASCRERVS